MGSVRSVIVKAMVHVYSLNRLKSMNKRTKPLITPAFVGHGNHGKYALKKKGISCKLRSFNSLVPPHALGSGTRSAMADASQTFQGRPNR